MLGRPFRSRRLRLPVFLNPWAVLLMLTRVASFSRIRPSLRAGLLLPGVVGGLGCYRVRTCAAYRGGGVWGVLMSAGACFSFLLQFFALSVFCCDLLRALGTLFSVEPFCGVVSYFVFTQKIDTCHKTMRDECLGTSHTQPL